MRSLLLFNANPLPFLYVIPTSTDPLRSSRILLQPANTMPDFQIETLLNLINRIFSAFLTCAFALGGALIGIITGAIKGQTTETGLLRGAGVGAVTGAITALQIMDMMANGEPFSKVALLCSLLNGKVFVEWVSPAMLKAYQWQTNAIEMSLVDMFDIETTGTRGLSEDAFSRLPKCRFANRDFENEEEGRELPSCRHVFHLECIDEWLIRQGSCPICRGDV
ncbi:unnamed protein product [Lactuca saligna]|uniref:RING-type domain-containing protein n=1 Tax=Lactuca saligna TaxID=75948 RepID=A0AA36EGH4_LACSI|nr:unnamed protein product [Lactuca saligna]